ncbi:MAG TPA: single-stranded DNA-binding protein [Planctomycetota bacterium]|nr:single-stranded DNA-binding protein [Planctomycetota bacterium]
MSNLNKVMLMGRLTRDPELRYTPQGSAVTEIGVAINREYTVGTERRKETTFVDVTLWKRQAEVVCQYLKKGGPIFIEGRLSLDSWETQDGQKRSRLRVVAENFQFLGGRPEGEGGSSRSRGDGARMEGSGEGGDGSERQGAEASRGGQRHEPAGGPREASGGPQSARSYPSEEAASVPDDGSLGLDDSEIPF